MRNWARKSFLSERSRVLPAIFKASLSQSKRLAHLVYPKFSPWRQPVQQRAGAATGRERQYRHELRAARAYYRPETKTWDLENVRLAYYDAAGNITRKSFVLR